MEQKYKENSELPKMSPFWRQVIFGRNESVIILISAGVTAGYSSILLPQLKKSDSVIKITEDQESWIASISVLPMTVGCIIGGLLMEKYGRKTLHIYTCPLLIAGWILLGFSKTYAFLIIGRFITGLGAGLTAPSCMVYVGESTSPKYRGLFLSLLMSGLSIGMFIAHLLGTYLSWQITSFISSAIPLIALIVIIFIPESSAWLASKMRMEEAEKAFLWCRGYSAIAKDEMTIMFENQQKRRNNNIKFYDYARCFKKREFYMPFVVVNVYFITTQLAGVNAIPFYSIQIMKDTIGNRIDSYDSMLILDAVRVVNAILASILTKQMGRRQLTMLSGSGTTISLIALSCILNFSDNSSEVIAYIKLSLLVSYISFITIGLLPLPWTLTGELFSPSFRGVGSGVSSAISFIAYFIIVKSSPTMFKNLGTSGTFLIFGLFALAGTIYLFFYLPETKDRTLEEIQKNFKEKDTDEQCSNEFEASINI